MKKNNRGVEKVDKPKKVLGIEKISKLEF